MFGRGSSYIPATVVSSARANHRFPFPVRRLLPVDGFSIVAVAQSLGRLARRRYAAPDRTRSVLRQTGLPLCAVVPAAAYVFPVPAVAVHALVAVFASRAFRAETCTKHERQ